MSLLDGTAWEKDFPPQDTAQPATRNIDLKFRGPEVSKVLDPSNHAERMVLTFWGEEHYRGWMKQQLDAARAEGRREGIKELQRSFRTIFLGEAP